MSPNIYDITLDTYEKWPGIDHETIYHAVDRTANYEAIIALHSTVLGPAIGGTRMWRYDDRDAAVRDALRLSEGMTFKTAAAALPFGGGKSVILEPSHPYNREAIMRAHGRAVAALNGRYITAVDLGTSRQDMDIVRTQTEWVGGSSNPVDNENMHTAHGVVRAILACAQWRWNSTDLHGRSAVVQGLGGVGYFVCKELHQLGVKLKGSDIDAARAQVAAQEFSLDVVDVDAVYDVEADIFSPCATGGIINPQTISRLKCSAIAGAANNQLLLPSDGDLLDRRGITYAPDFIANAGGVISGTAGVMGLTHDQMLAHVDRIYDATLAVLQEARRRNVTAQRAAQMAAHARLTSLKESTLPAQPAPRALP